ncbi:hypothetical protein ACFO1B_14830 [Dactylosporangium siamense]|uniref:Uncharacterized protein n=1 Tax=Dactylosporangium siamense TaxID=685454 RepID=A0A919PKC1_9ACTN|nr:hypothetical protein [Dactylosporangium siamense]GIG45107.1 hypothetical protein Dsi01nite_031480 [Dactylosporangium siamense]
MDPTLVEPGTAAFAEPGTAAFAEPGELSFHYSARGFPQHGTEALWVLTA